MDLKPRTVVIAAILTFSVAAGAQAAAEPPATAVIEHPPPGGGDPEAELAPEVTITERGETTIEEYRVNGQLYMIKIIPKKGVPYYLVDSNGDGLMSQRFNDLKPGFLIPSWVILRWR
ncbi:MAG: DUF2782 domain-containing protein [Gammaproteobacteria bacterium]|nr:DUF2782 domain-containing protein [Gammaproteobacteria bacterium]